MVLLEIATLIMAGVGLADYYHTTVYRENLRQLKNKYGEHPDIDEAFEDICTLGGEYFEMPELDLESKHPRIKMGHFYTYGANGPAKVLNEFFTTQEDRSYFFKKYEREFEKQARLRNKKLERMYDTIVPLYKNGKFESIGSEKMESRIFQAPYMLARDKSHYNEILNYMCEHTIWKEIFEAGPDIYGGEYQYTSKWLIKENIFNKINNKEAYNILFECCYFYYKDKLW